MPTTLISKDAFNDTQQRILDAAIACVKQWGIEKTSLNDIAKQAGVTRPTVYSYFPNRNDVIRTALLQSGYAFAERLMKHINRYDTVADRLVESILFALEELPREPYLAVLTEADISGYINKDALSDPEGLAICLSLFREIFRPQPVDDDTLAEITELTVRLALSLLMITGSFTRNTEQQRQFLRRRLLPAAGLA
ncbi:MAG TPA: TetR/AcrR family transcriptional regulator [Pseudomonadales bacterium]